MVIDAAYGNVAGFLGVQSMVVELMKRNCDGHIGLLRYESSPISIWVQTHSDKNLWEALSHNHYTLFEGVSYGDKI